MQRSLQVPDAGIGCRRSTSLTAMDLAAGRRCTGVHAARSRCIAAAWLALSISARCLATPTAAAPAIEAQPLPAALMALAKATGLQMMYASSIAKNLRSTEVPAGLPAVDALSRMLAGTGVRYEFVNPRTVRLFRADPAAVPARLPYPTTRPRAEQAPGESASDLASVIVTTSARLDAGGAGPASVQSWTRDEMSVSGVHTVADLAALTPGVEFDSFPELASGVQTNIAIRGVNARDGSTTALYLDGVRIPHDPGSTFGPPFPAVFDVEQVDILRGPQGVLYGEGAEGGVVSFSPVSPRLDQAEVSAHVESATTERGAGSWEAGLAAGIPVVRGLIGMRLSGSERRNGGFVDRIDPFTLATVDANANRDTAKNLRIAFLLAPGSSLTISPAYTQQTTTVHDSSSFYTYLSAPGSGILRSGKLLQQPYESTFRLGSLRVAFELGGAELSSTTGRFERTASALYDQTNTAGFHYPNPLGIEYPVSYSDAVGAPMSLRQLAFSEDVRITSADPEARARWLLGAFYTHSGAFENQNISTPVESDGENISGRNFNDRNEVQAELYGHVAIRLADRWQATLGLRGGHDRRDVLIRTPDQQTLRPLIFHAAQSQSPLMPDARLTYALSGDAALYAIVARGWRAGGVNTPVSSTCPIASPQVFGPDALWNYELGFKGGTLGGRASFDASVFQSRWTNLQTPYPLPNECSTSFVFNAGRAIAEGAELALRATPSERLRLSLTAAYVETRYQDTINGITGVIVRRGDVVGSLPLVPSPWNVTAAGDLALLRAQRHDTRFYAEMTLHSHNPGPFTSEDPTAAVYAPRRLPDPATRVVNLRLQDSWRSFDVSVFLNNVLDSQPTLQRRTALGVDTLTYATTFRPRTVGLGINWRPTGSSN